MSLTINQLVDDNLELFSLPEVVMRAVDLINDPDSSAVDIGKVISDDPGLTARLLKIVNSPFYNFPSRIDTVSRAITVVGTLELLDLILATSVIKKFNGIPTDLVDMDEFWSHSLYSGIAARTLARRHRAPNTERYFIAGLLHNIGALVIYQRIPDIAAEALTRAREGNEILFQVEQELLGFHHGDVGARLLEQWRLPDAFQTAVRYHHTPMAAETFQLETAIVHLADIIASSVQTADAESGRVPPMDDGAWELVGLPIDSMEALVNETDVAFDEARAVIIPRADVA